MEDEPGSAPSLRASNRLRVIQALQLLGVTSRADLRATPACRARRCPPSSPASRPRAWSWTATPTGAPRGGGRPPALIALDPSAGLRDRHRLRQAPPRGRARGPLAPAARRGVARDDGRLRRRGRHRAGGPAGGDGARGGRRGRGPAARGGHGPARAGAPQRRRRLLGDPSRAGRARTRPSAWPSGCPWRSGSATTRTSARSPSPPGAPGATPAASSTSSSRRASARES